MYQRDVLLGCLHDAGLLMKRSQGLSDLDRGTIVSLLWDKRCQPWKFYRDEQRARSALRN